MNKEIILESHPDFTCNTFELYRYMLSRGLQSKYRLTWLVDRNTKLPKLPEHVGVLVRDPAGFMAKFKCYRRCNRAAAVITSNRHIPKNRVSKKQLNIYLDHGSHLKRLAEADGRRKQLKCDYVTCQSDFFVPFNMEQYSLTETQVVCTGLPRNDQLYRNHDSIKRLVPNADAFRKIILWAPTFRLHKDNVRLDCKHNYPLGLPILNDLQEAIELNDALRADGILLMIKPHPAQSLDVIRALELSHIRFLYNQDLADHDIQLNELLAQTDAMLTDYSSVYYDYLLLNRPIGLTFDDFDDYQRDKGFVFDDPLSILKGSYLYTKEDLIGFIHEIGEGRDLAREEREATLRKVHTFMDARSSERVYDFVIQKLMESHS
ncbi:MAG: CDP-glycerol glycerophosphotransferase family protein [Lachnospiraceae bacterium]|nr:CDP-glycerol glycerophosphotransferase family protein [Lachnospiraceae bacterium]